MSTSEPDNHKKYRDKAKRWNYILCAISTSVFLVFVVIFVASILIDFSFLSESSCTQSSIFGWINKYTFCFYGSDWNEETYLSTISDFYTTLITILVAVQALISWISFVVIKNSNRQNIEDEVEKELPKYFGTKRSDEVLGPLLQSRVPDVVKKEIIKWDSDNQKSIENLQAAVFDELTPNIESIKETIRILTQKIKVLEGDNGDEPGEPAEGRLQE